MKMRRFAAKPLYAGGVLRVRVILHDHVVTPIQFTPTPRMIVRIDLAVWPCRPMRSERSWGLPLIVNARVSSCRISQMMRSSGCSMIAWMILEGKFRTSASIASDMEHSRTGLTTCDGWRPLPRGLHVHYQVLR